MDVVVSDNADVLADRVAADFVKLVQETLRTQRRFTVALSGGATPEKLYTQLSRAPYVDQIPWAKIWIFFGDERCVPPDHPDSNFRMARETLLEKAPVIARQVFRMKGEDPPPQAARDYENEMRSVFGPDATLPALDLILLGLGSDGHTASLFPGSPALADGDRWVVGNVIRSMQTVRLTLTLPVINAAHQVWFLVTGAKKADVFARMQQQEDPACPASLVQPTSGHLCAYVDRAVVPSTTPTQA